MLEGQTKYVIVEVSASNNGAAKEQTVAKNLNFIRSMSMDAIVVTYLLRT